MNRIPFKEIMAYAIATALICVPVWIGLKFVVPTDWSLILSLEVNEGFFSAQRALIGTFIFGILSIAASLSYDLVKIPKLLIVNVLRISLSIFLGLYWFNKITYMWTVKTNFVLGLDFAFVIWPILLFLNVIVAALIIVFEPWRFIIMTNQHVRGNLPSTNVLIKTLMRLISYIIVFSLFVWFSSAPYPLEDTTILISTFVFMLLGVLTMYPIFRDVGYAPR